MTCEYSKDDIRTPMKAVLWEETKGKLRAMVAIQGSYYGGGDDQISKWNELEKRVEAFIFNVEGDALHE